VTRVEPAGLGDRVIVDTTSLLEPEEGLLVGSTAELLFHVRSEAVGSRYTRARPFRVNAGAAHSYTILVNGETRYLCELRAGESVPVARVNVNGRSVRVGRLKIERRPLVLIEARSQGTVGTLFLQEAETVRLSAPDRALSVTELSVGDEIACVRLPPARHLGQVVHERVEER
jgi:3-dehydroquinate synthase II